MKTLTKISSVRCNAQRKSSDFHKLVSNVLFKVLDLHWKDVLCVVLDTKDLHFILNHSKLEGYWDRSRNYIIPPPPPTIQRYITDTVWPTPLLPLSSFSCSCSSRLSVSLVSPSLGVLTQWSIVRVSVFFYRRIKYKIWIVRIWIQSLL